MITIISGTNRKASNTRIVAGEYVRVLNSFQLKHQLFSLEELPRDFAFTYLDGSQTEEVKAIIEKYFHHAQKFIFIVPEYQGTFPGIFKLLIDAVPTRELAHKKVLLAGVASGRGGNMRGLDQLTNMLHYLGMTIFPGHLPISRVRDISSDGKITDETTLKNIRTQVEKFVEF
ncbi:MAG: NAD(P)H-dependent oxidoreductase [Bacteroidetes bacterium]|nr:NAD(P)H-dependent oxidoreductase [Bacteroidota bacterium]